MQNKPITTTPSAGILSLCSLLWLFGLIFTGLAIWLFTSRAAEYGALALTAGLLCAAAGLGIYRRRRWGAVLFGGLGLLGSANHLIVTLNRYNDLSGAGLVQAVAALVSIFAAILIPVGIMYLVLVLWKNSG